MHDVKKLFHVSIYCTGPVLAIFGFECSCSAWVAADCWEVCGCFVIVKKQRHVDLHMLALHLQCSQATTAGDQGVHNLMHARSRK